MKMPPDSAKVPAIGFLARGDLTTVDMVVRCLGADMGRPGLVREAVDAVTTMGVQALELADGEG